MLEIIRKLDLKYTVNNIYYSEQECVLIIRRFLVMGRREDTLKKILNQGGANITDDHLPRPAMSDFLRSGIEDEITNVYKALGGILEKFPARLKKWDMEVNGVAVEFDEERHFNRYRLITLDSKVYRKLSSFPLDIYKDYCNLYEEDCIRTASFGGYWTNMSCEKQFGCASAPGDLDGNGSPRWKQRAFYDYLRDIAPLVTGVKLARVSIWDKLSVSNKSITVAEILDNKLEASVKLHQLIKERTCLS